MSEANKNEMTALNTPTAIGDGQSSQKCTANSITDWDENFNSSEKSFEELQKEMLLMMDKSYLKTVSMNELYETTYDSKPPLIDGLLYAGTYLFVGGSKLGKSFLWHSLLIISAQESLYGIIPLEKEQSYTLPLRITMVDCKTVYTVW